MDKPIQAKIVSATTAVSGNIRSDSILMQFNHKGKQINQDFESPFLTEKNIRLWRSLVLVAVTGKFTSPEEPIASNFESYQASIIGHDVYIMYNEDDIYAIGKQSGNLFFPEAYGLWGR